MVSLQARLPQTQVIVKCDFELFYSYYPHYNKLKYVLSQPFGEKTLYNALQNTPLSCQN
jgi:hypothetical protein